CRNTTYIAILGVKNIDIGERGNGTGETTLPSRSNLAHHPKMGTFYNPYVNKIFFNMITAG
ncbi:MAG: hypothetical protein WBY88_00470, partial [Desulfosarcina sp.]